jgi:hypothetical protein
VALGAGDVGVAISQRESSVCVVEGGSVPVGGCVALGAGSERESLGVRVRWIIGLLPSGQMANGIAAIVILYRQIVIVVDMALSAGNAGVRAV